MASEWNGSGYQRLREPLAGRDRPGGQGDAEQPSRDVLMAKPTKVRWSVWVTQDPSSDGYHGEGDSPAEAFYDLVDKFNSLIELNKNRVETLEILSQALRGT